MIQNTRILFIKIIIKWTLYLAARDSDSSDRSRQCKLNTFWKGFIILEAIRNIRNSWEAVKISALSGRSWFQPSWMPLRVLRLQWRKSLQKARELELEVEPEDVTELLPSHDKTWMNKGLLLMDEQRKWFLEVGTTPGEDVM